MSKSRARRAGIAEDPAGLMTRRAAVRAGALGVMGLGLGQLKALQAAAEGGPATTSPGARSVIYIFLSGGLSQIDSFDMKPDAKKEFRGSFNPIATSTEGIRICEHLPLLARRSNAWSILSCLSTTAAPRAARPGRTCFQKPERVRLSNCERFKTCFRSCQNSIQAPTADPSASPTGPKRAGRCIALRTESGNGPQTKFPVPKPTIP